jgi:uncharacterized membrane protein HdeD (DUF308 family)
MSTTFPYFLSNAAEELRSLRRNWGWIAALGAVLIAIGIMAIAYPLAATITTVEVFGVLLLIGGAVEAVGSFGARGWGGFLLHFLCGMLAAFFGVLLLDRPLLGAAGYTLVLAMFFFASGLARIIFAVSNRFSGWAWVLLSGGVSLALGVMIWREMPEAALWVIGTFVGIDLIFNGMSWLMLALAVRRVGPRETARVEPAFAHG